MQDAAMIEFAQKFRDGILQGRPSDFMCAAICWPLAPLLEMNGVTVAVGLTGAVRTSYGSCNHVWLSLADGRVLDPTADQFNNRRRKLPPVYLGPPIKALHRNDTK